MLDHRRVVVGAVVVSFGVAVALMSTLGGREAPPATAQASAGPAGAQQPASEARRGTVTGRIELAPALRPALRPDAEVVVSAYAIDGPRVPLAMRRFDAARLPLDFTLDDTHAVNPAFALSKAVQVVVVAQVVTRGASAAAAGDPEGRSSALPAGADGVLVHIDRRRP